MSTQPLDGGMNTEIVANGTKQEQELQTKNKRNQNGTRKGKQDTKTNRLPKDRNMANFLQLKHKY